jgi:two-component system NtrC family sensor kinase
VFLAYLLSERVSQPVRDLIRQVEKVSAGDLSGRVPVVARDEIGLLAEKFNRMMADLRAAREEIEDHQRSLEERIRQIRAELEQAQKDLLKSEKLAAVGQLAAGVAHELNNPLAGILLSSQLLATEVADANVRKTLSEIEEQSFRCKRIIEGLLNFAREGRAERRVADANVLLENAIGSLEKRELLRDITVEKDLAAGPLRVKVDPGFVEQAFANLLENAVSAMHGKGRISVSTGLAGEHVEVSIRDWEPGIPQDNLDRIFDPFFTTKGTGDGAGLGLSVSHGIVERHGGSIRVQSEEGQGAVFVVSLPACADGEEA